METKLLTCKHTHPACTLINISPYSLHYSTYTLSADAALRHFLLTASSLAAAHEPATHTATHHPSHTPPVTPINNHTYTTHTHSLVVPERTSTRAQTDRQPASQTDSRPDTQPDNQPASEPTDTPQNKYSYHNTPPHRTDNR